MTSRFRYLDEFDEPREIDLPDGWTVEIVPKGYTACAHSEDKSASVMEEALTRTEAMEKLRRRMIEIKTDIEESA